MWLEFFFITTVKYFCIMIKNKHAIGVFDSGYGGLTVLKEIKTCLPEYDFIYLGDNARAPYGPLSFKTVYEYTLECIKWFFKQGCTFVILACNTASAKALRTIQQKDLPIIAPNNRVLGVIRPTTEIINEYTQTNHVGIMATVGTVKSNSYVIEINKFHPDINVMQLACPKWVQIVERGQILTTKDKSIIKEDIDTLLARDNKIDCILLACTHYPLLLNTIKMYLPTTITVVTQGQIVAQSLLKYLKKHSEIERNCSKNGTINFYTTGVVNDFNTHATQFFGANVQAIQINID